MYSHDELKSLHTFVKSTAEGNLKKMVVGGRMTEAHLRMLLKIARNTKEDEFIACFEGDTFPKVKFANNEIALKETLYGICAEAFSKVGLLTLPVVAGKKAA